MQGQKMALERLAELVVPGTVVYDGVSHLIKSKTSCTISLPTISRAS
jgi:hypothetical protein